MAVSIVVKFDDRVFSVNSVKKAAYRFIDKFSCEIMLSINEIVCTLNFQDNLSESAANFIAEDFKREVLDQDLRSTIASETEQIRNLILAHAFSKTSLISKDG